MRELIEQLKTELFGAGGTGAYKTMTHRAGQGKKRGRAADKRLAHQTLAHPRTASGERRSGQHLAARSRLAKMKLKARARKRVGG